MLLAVAGRAEELRRLEERSRQETGPTDKRRHLPPLPEVESGDRVQDEALPERQHADAVFISEVTFIGPPADVALLHQLPSTLTPSISVAQHVRASFRQRRMTEKELLKQLRTLSQQELVARHYYLARLLPVRSSEGDGVLQLYVSFGKIGNIKLNGEPEPWFSSRQILRSLDVEADDVFDYERLYQGLYRLNRQGSLTVDAKVTAHAIPQSPERYADVTLDVHERLPLSVRLATGNRGNDSTGQMRYEVSASYQNLTHAFDTLSATIQAGDDPEKYAAVTGFYERPLDSQERLLLRIFGGYADSHPEETTRYFDVTGEQSFYGVQLAWRMVDTPRRQLQAALGRVWRRTDSRLYFDRQLVWQATERTAPFDLNMRYADRAADAFGGKTQIQASFVCNDPGLDGTSQDGTFTASASDRRYDIWRWGISRYQHLPWPGFSAHLRHSGQYTDDALITAEQISAGGALSVRGYREDAYTMDKGAVGSLELFLPSWERDMPSVLLQNDSVRLVIRPLCFVDWAILSSNTSGEPYRETTERIASLGIGVRILLGDGVQFVADYGHPLESQADRLHLFLEADF